MTDNTQPEAREFTMSQYASKDDMIGAMRKRIAELESELEAVGAGGVQALSAAPVALPPYPPLPMQFACSGVFAVYSADQMRAYVDADRAARAPADSVAAPAIGDELRDTLVAVSAAIAERDDRAAQKMICEILATSGTPPAEQQAAPKAAPEDPPGIRALMCVISSLRDTEHFSDEEGVLTNDLRTLRDWAYAQTAAFQPSPTAQGAAITSESGTPPAEQQAQPGAVYAELPAPTASIGTDDAWHEAAMRDFADRTHALRMQAAPKAAPGEPSYSEKWDAELGRAAMRFVDRAGDVHPGIDDAETICAEFYKAMSEVIERMPHVQRMTPRKAAPGVGNSGFDYQTAADFLSGKTVIVEALREFVHASRRAHDEKTALSAMLLSVRGVLASREAEIALLKKALLEAEAAPQQEAQAPVASEEERRKLKGLMLEVWACAKPQPDVTNAQLRALLSRCLPHIRTLALAEAPKPAPAPLSEMPYEKRKAIQEGEQIGASDAWFKARHEMLDTVDRRNVFRAGFDRGWNAALAAQGGKDALLF